MESILKGYINAQQSSVITYLATHKDNHLKKVGKQITFFMFTRKVCKKGPQIPTGLKDFTKSMTQLKLQ